MMPSTWNLPSSRVRNRMFSCVRLANSAALPTVITSFSRSVGLVRYSKAPLLVAFTALSIVPCAVSSTTWLPG